MKTAKLSVISFEAQCPYCKEGVEYPYTGSLTWLIFDGDIPTGITAGQKVECSECGEVFKLPSAIIDNKLPK